MAIYVALSTLINSIINIALNDFSLSEDEIIDRFFTYEVFLKAIDTDGRLKKEIEDESKERKKYLDENPSVMCFCQECGNVKPVVFENEKKRIKNQIIKERHKKKRELSKEMAKSRIYC
jgi:phosphotransferase system IIB component